MPTPYLQPKGAEPPEKPEICLFAQTNFRNQMRAFGIKTDDRRRHMYVIGKTGMGKTTMMENMVLSDIYAGHGIGIVDPHGDFAEKIINFIPSNRINDVVYFNPADVENPIGFNVFEVQTEEQKHLVASGLMGIFKKIWPDVWSSRMEYILNNTILALLDYPGSTLLGINRLLADAKYRKKVVKQLTDPVVKAFWRDEFANYEPRYAKEAVAPIQNKIGQFLSASVIRNMVAQVKSTINVREIMDSGKIFIMNLSKGRIGEDNSRLLGGMLITKLQLAAMERVDVPESQRRDFFLYVDEFQNFASPSFANILSEARKYRLSLIMAHQYVKQLDEIVADAVFGNVGTIVSFRVGAGDAEALAKEFAPVFLEENIVNLSKFSVLLKLMIDGVASRPFSAQTMPPIGKVTGSAEKVIRVSRERYSKRRDTIEQKILKWSGMEYNEGVDDTDDEDDDDDEKNTTFKKRDDRKDFKNNKSTGGFVQKRQQGNKDNSFVQKKEQKIEVPSPVEPVSKINDSLPALEPEQTISLSSLLPKDQPQKKEELPDGGDFYTNFESNILPAQDEPKPQTANPSVVINQQSPTQAVTSQNPQTPKKKRRRRRKKKSGGQNMTPNQQPQTSVASNPNPTQNFPQQEKKPVEIKYSTIPQQHLSQKIEQIEEKKDVEPQDNKPKRLDVDQVVKFNGDDDDYEETRFEK